MLNLLNSKKRSLVILKRPVYFERHVGDGRSFLVLGCGDSVLKYRDGIQDFIKRYNPITIGCNFLNRMYVTDYHLFVNRGRFCKYVSSIDRRSVLLLNPHIARRVIKKKIRDRYYEGIMCKNIYPAEDGYVRIKNGVIYSKGGQAGTIAAAVAYVMGAKEIYLAGFDGFSSAEGYYPHHYPGEPLDHDKVLKDYLNLDRCAVSILRHMQAMLKAREGSIKMITPTVFKEFYDGRVLK